MKNICRKYSFLRMASCCCILKACVCGGRGPPETRKISTCLYNLAVTLWARTRDSLSTERFPKTCKTNLNTDYEWVQKSARRLVHRVGFTWPDGFHRINRHFTHRHHCHRRLRHPPPC